MERATILYVNHVGQMCGAEQSLLALISALDQGRFAPVAACPDGPLAEALRSLGVRVHILTVRRMHRVRHPLSLPRIVGDWICGVAQIYRVARRERASLIHANSTTAQLYSGPVARLMGIPAVWHVRDLVKLGRLGRWLSRTADRVVAISDAVAAALVKEGISAKQVSRIYNGIDADAFAARAIPGAIRREFGLTRENRVATMIAQFAPWKRHADFLGAFARVAEQLPQARALIVGDEMFPDHAGRAESLRALCRELEIGERVIFTGHRGDVSSILADSDLLAIPSLAEPFGRVALEAMALGVPVVGTKAGGLPEVVLDGVTGLLVPPHAPEALASAMLKLLQDAELARRLGEAGRRRVREHFSSAETARQIARLYEKLLSQQPIGES